jgi:type I restriction enzyme R subunit
LNDQLFGQFAKCSSFLRQMPVHATCRKLGITSTKDDIGLKDWLDGRQANGIIFTTMQKFEESEEPLSERHNIIVMADEAHRGQYGLKEKVKMVENENGEKEAKIVTGTARIIRNCLPVMK